MRVSQRLDYALRALVLLAARPPGTHVAGGEIASRLGLPQRVVEQQLSALARAHVLASKRGACGGHALGRPASQINVADVVRAIEGDPLDAPRVSGSAASELWQRTADSLETYLAGTTIASLAERQAELDAASVHTYYI